MFFFSLSFNRKKINKLFWLQKSLLLLILVQKELKSLFLVETLFNYKNNDLYKNLFPRDWLKPCFFVTFIVIMSYIFLENLNQSYQVVLNIWRFSSWILVIFVTFLNLLACPCYKTTNDVNTWLVIVSNFLYLTFFEYIVNLFSEVEKALGN